MRRFVFDILWKPRGYIEEVLSKKNYTVMVRRFDNRVVNMASNIVGIGNHETVRRWDKTSKEYCDINNPEVIKMFNSSMVCVDRVDFFLGLYRIFIRSRK